LLLLLLLLLLLIQQHNVYFEALSLTSNFVEVETNFTIQ
jgi:hypothetical protein